MSKPSADQTVTNKVDPAQEARNKEVFQAGRDAQSPYQAYGGQEVAGGHQYSQDAYRDLTGLSGLFQNLGNQGQYQFDHQRQQGDQLMGQVNGPQAYRDAGDTGARALGGDQGAINQMMNPYQQGVIDQVKGQYGDLNAMAQRGINDQATRAGAFGGSRQGVASGVASAEIAKGLGQQIAGLQQGGFNDAMGRAGQAANLGLGAGQLGAQYGGLGLQAQGLANQSLGQQGAFGQAQQQIAGQQFGMGDYYNQLRQRQLDVNRGNFNEKRDWDVRNFDILKSASTGLPYGQSQTTPGPRTNVLGNMAGGAATGGAVGGPVGAVVGGGVGLLGSFF